VARKHDKSTDSQDDQEIDLSDTEQVNAEDRLRAMLVTSPEDAAEVRADADGGTPEDDAG
jgi:hypothetical protein